jgi:hypothetical protein
VSASSSIRSGRSMQSLPSPVTCIGVHSRK